MECWHGKHSSPFAMSVALFIGLATVATAVEWLACEGFGYPLNLDKFVILLQFACALCSSLPCTFVSPILGVLLYPSSVRGFSTSNSSWNIRPPNILWGSVLIRILATAADCWPNGYLRCWICALPLFHRACLGKDIATVLSWEFLSLFGM